MQLYSWNFDKNWFMAHKSCWLILCIFLVWRVIILCALFRCLESAVPLLSLQLKVVWCHLHSRKWDSPLLPMLKGGLLFCVVKGEKLLLLYMYMFAKWGPYTLTPRCHRFSVVPASCSQHLRWLVVCLVELFMVFRLKYGIYIKTACSHFFSRNGMLFCILNSSLLMGFHVLECTHLPLFHWPFLPVPKFYLCSSLFFNVDKCTVLSKVRHIIYVARIRFTSVLQYCVALYNRKWNFFYQKRRNSLEIYQKCLNLDGIQTHETLFCTDKQKEKVLWKGII